MHHLESELDQLKQRLMTMAGTAEQAVTQAIKALLDRDDDLARSVRERDSILDQLEMELDDSAIQLLSKAPLASDLRLITMVMKISRDLERIGDEATTISRRAIELSQEPQLKSYIDIPRMAGIGLEMLRDALDAFVTRDTEEARAVVLRDKEVDQINKQLHRELSSYMVERPSTITRCLNLMVISKSLERIADHAANIAEDVVYLHEARDIRHSGQPRDPSSSPSADFPGAPGEIPPTGRTP